MTAADADRLAKEWKRVWTTDAGVHLDKSGNAPESVDVEAIAREYADELKDAIARSEGPFDPSDLILRDAVQDVDAASQANGWRLSVQPLVATLPHSHPNAKTYYFRPEQDRPEEYLVILNRGVFALADRFAQLIATAAPKTIDGLGNRSISTKFEDWKPRLLDEELLRRFLSVVFAFLSTGDVSRIRPFRAPQEADSAVILLRAGWEMFSVAHEYGHVVAAHLQKSRRSAVPEGSASAAQVAYQQAQESEADRLGADLTVDHLMTKYRIPAALAYWGIDLFFSVMIMFSGAAKSREPTTVGVPDTSHPPFEFRKQQVREHVTARYAPQAKAAAELFYLSDCSTKAVDFLWSLSFGQWLEEES